MRITLLLAYFFAARMTKLLTAKVGIGYNSGQICLVNSPQANLFRELP